MVHEELREVKRIARTAGAILLRHYRNLKSVEWKGPGDPVTIADREASESIVGELQRLFPEDAVLSEEVPDTAVRLGRQRVWMVDPMDGTREFIDHREDFAVQIGLAIDGTPTLGVVYQPTKDKLYSAAAGIGATLEIAGAVTPLRVSTATVAEEMTLAVSRSHRSGRVDRVAEELRIPNSIHMGSVGLKVGAICEGLAHLYIHIGSKTQIWDTCGPEAILFEAGGRLTDMHGKRLEYTRPESRNPNGVVASNGVIHERAVRTIQHVLSTQA